MKPNVLTGEIQRKSVKACRLDNCDKRNLLAYFENAYALDEWLFTSLKDEKYFYLCPDRLRLPLIFYYCHPAVVFVNKLMLCGMLKKRIDPRLETMFETGVDEMTWDDTENYRMGGEYDWPTVEEARIYRKKVRDKVKELILTTPLELPVTEDSPWWAIWMGIEHERIHLETSSVLIRQLPVEMVEKPIGWVYAPVGDTTEELNNDLITSGNTAVQIGKDHGNELWGWDNEYGKRVVNVHEFAASKYPITNGEFERFVNDGGYDKEELWSKEGWKWRTYKGAKHPSFWVCNSKCKSGCGASLQNHTHCYPSSNDQYRLRLMFDEVALPAHWPVEVNYHEAKAFCTWKGDEYRLPTEAEYHVMRGLEVSDNPATMENTETLYNFDLQYGSSTPVNFYPPSSTGFYDTFGNTWEWCEDDFNGLDKFKTHFLYDDFSTPCFDGKHTIILGGSWVSTGDETSRHARFSFRKHFFQHMGFRVAKTINGESPLYHVSTPLFVVGHGLDEIERTLPKSGLQIVNIPSTNSQLASDTDASVHKLSAHVFNVKLYETTLKTIIPEIKSQSGKAQALVIGCGTGRIAFQLTKNFAKVVACDTSSKCIDIAIKLQQDKFDLGKLNGTRIHFQIPDGAKKSNVVFKQLTWLPCELTKQFNLVVMDLLTRAQNPKAWLSRLWELLKDDNSRLIVTNTDEKAKKTLQHYLAFEKNLPNEVSVWKLKP